MNTENLFKEDKDLSEALNEFIKQNPNSDSGDIQTFIIGWQEAVKKLIMPIVSQQRELLLTYEKWSCELHGFKCGNDVLLTIDGFLKANNCN